MFLRFWRYITLTLIALTMGLAFSHALEAPVKLRYDYPLYLAVSHSLYEFYARVGAFAEVGAVIAAVVWAILLRDQRLAFKPAAVCAVLMFIAHAAWWLWVAPANSQMAGWNAGSPAPDWTSVRAQWEYTHFARFWVLLAALIAAQMSAFRAIPSGVSAESPRLRRAQVARRRASIS